MGTPLAADRGARRTAGRYELLTQIGSGGEGSVHLARSSGIGGFEREVAIKIVHARNPDSTAALLEEAKLAARIRHPNVVPVFDVGEDEGGVFLVMEYVEGDSLAGLLKSGGPMPTRIALRILADALTGLHAAHELFGTDGQPLHLVHRDFSPHNILVGIDGVARLTDFGIAKAISRAGVTKTGVFKGKVRYASPEQVAGLPLDRRSDIWSAGIVAWELLTGQRLYSELLDEVGIMMRIASEPPPRVRSLRTDITPALDEVVAAALSGVSQRLSSADELRRRLIEAFGEPIADPAEVAEHVRALAEPGLERRRLLAAEARDPAASRVDVKRASADTRIDEILAQETTTRDVPPSRKIVWIVAGVLASILVVGLALGAARFVRTDAPQDTPISAAPLDSTSGSAPAASSASPPPVESNEPATPIAAAASTQAPATRPRSKRPPLAPSSTVRRGTGLDIAPSPYEKTR